MADEAGEVNIRGENISRIVNTLAQKKFKLRQILLIQKSTNQTESYFEETNTILTAGGNRIIQGTPRGALPAELHPSWTKKSAENIKFMGQSTIHMEDQLLAAIPVQARTFNRVAEAIASAVDSYIYTNLTAATSTSGVVASADAWNSTTESNRDPIGDMLIGIAAMGSNNYDWRANGWILVNELDYSSLLRNSKVINNPSFKTADVVTNGVVAQLVGGKIIVTDSVVADEMMMVVGQRAATWMTAASMQTVAIPDPGINVKIRSWEMGHIEITDPQGLYTVTNTQA